MKIKLSKSQWEEMGRKSGWLKIAQQDKLRTINNSINNVEQQTRSLPQNGKKITELLVEIRKLVQGDPSVGSGISV